MSEIEQYPIVMYYSPFCGYCMMAKRLLAAKKVEFHGINVADAPDKRKEMLTLANGQRTVPQIFIHGQHIGGFTDMAALEQRGELDSLLNPQAE